MYRPQRFPDMPLYLFGLMLMWLTSCSPLPPAPAFLEPPVTAVLPVLDFRQDRLSSPASWADNPMTARILRKKGYHVVFISESVSAQEAIHLPSVPRPRLKALGPANARWLILPMLYEVRRTASLQSAYTATCAGQLYDKLERQVVWRNSLRYHELAGGDIQGQWRRGVAQGCFRQLLKQLPDQSLALARLASLVLMRRMWAELGFQSQPYRMRVIVIEMVCPIIVVL